MLFSVNSALATYGIQIKTSGCLSNQALPDKDCSPGAVLTTNTKVICKSGYTKTVRNVTESTKKKVFKEYGIPYSQHSNYEVDHIISLELGGSNDISNLYPESYTIKDNAREKDKFENYLHKQVCSGMLDINEAQRQISSDWLYYYQTEMLRIKVATTTEAIPTSKKTEVTNTIVPVVIALPQTTTKNVETTTVSGPEVKKSKTGICHARGTSYYDKTTNFTPYNSINDCLTSGGRLPTK